MTAHTIETASRNLHVLNKYEKGNNSIPVFVRLIFLRIGQIDTRAEKFQAHVAIEARWFLNSDNDENKILSILSMDDQFRLNNGEIIKLSKDFPENNWYPQLFLLNIGQDCKEEIKYTIKKSNSQIQIREFHDVNASFYSKFDLHHFPTDIQELSISIGSALFDSEVTLDTDSNRPSGINREAFFDQQEWKLYDHVQTRTKFIKGFLFQNDEDYSLDKPGHRRKRSILTIACHAARRADYFFWNGYFLVFLITTVCFSSFAIPPNGVQFRIAIACTLLLTSIAFRLTISNALPNISYLTLIDLYAIVSIFVLIILCIWHSIIGTLVFIYDEYINLKSDSYWARIDRRIFYVLVSLYIIVHVAMGIWYYYVPISRKRQMKELEIHYRRIINESVDKNRLAIGSSSNGTTKRELIV
ncbi:unnamed protein product [Adineta steineri]|uniref:Neurotransmitter-gated ion-channel ligand-binding domain-containing protein n=1 Tax=Adineta steineri TaxID=433720 RepID=A0A814Y552_9BILA|nr:unnamed protein product [Adineta steineri]CAF3557291.1 unnamed protein product [Adineta steineri]